MTALGSRPRPTLREQIANCCVHFTGTQHDTCKAGVNYVALAGGQILATLPCLRGGFWAEKAAQHGGFRVCTSERRPTPEEVEAEASAAESSLREFSEHIKAGRCPHCKRPVRMRQVGHCVYGDCGHRLYQGKLPKAPAVRS